MDIAKAVQDRVSPAGQGKTMHHSVVEGSLNCLAVNHDCTQVVVAGRNVFKVFGVEDDKFSERVNLRVGKNLNLNFSACDVAWNPIEDNILASAATNGAVVTWNLNKASKSKQDVVFNEHKRTVNKVCFHPTEKDQLMSGSQDGLIKLFDIRKKEVGTIFNGKSESVRHVDFSPFTYFQFAAAHENGNIQMWDMRNNSRSLKQFTAHSGPAFSLDWHPEEKFWLATSGRDKTIKVWDTQGNQRVKILHNVQTIASVARIRWRPQRKHQIASCALLLDFSISIWDIRRPFVPCAAFDEHKDVVTGIVWKHRDPHAFFTSSRDCTVYQHMFKDAKRPADEANPVGIDISVVGDVASAVSDKVSKPSGKSASSYNSTKFPHFFRRAPDRSEEFIKADSVLSEFGSVDLDLSMEWFRESALRYRLTGRPLEELCEINAQVAADLDRIQVAQTWEMLKNFYSSAKNFPTSQMSKTSNSLGSKALNLLESESDKGDAKSGNEHKSSEQEKQHAEPPTGISEEESDVQDLDLVETSGGATLTSLIGGVGINGNHSDFFFGDGDMEQLTFDYETFGNLQNVQDWTLPTEAIQIRHDIPDRASSPDPGTAAAAGGQHDVESPSSNTESDANVMQQQKEMQHGVGQIREELLTVPTFQSNIPMWDFSDIICSMLHRYAETGDVQMATTVVIILGDKIVPHIDEVTREQWFMSYIDLLGRFELWTIVTEIIQLCRIPAIQMMNQESTSIRTNCSQCNKFMERNGWVCDRCHKATTICAICHHTVKGLFVWCQGCSHGGHLEHVRAWFSSQKQCPTGCGHNCEFT